ncbi:hypothetical protein OG789_27835 [Streptomyces jietaisiensis]|nr:hypothetical protein [Streptomyces jietaisiensis]
MSSGGSAAQMRQQRLEGGPALRRLAVSQRVIFFSTPGAVVPADLAALSRPPVYAVDSPSKFPVVSSVVLRT